MKITILSELSESDSKSCTFRSYIELKNGQNVLKWNFYDVLTISMLIMLIIYRDKFSKKIKIEIIDDFLIFQFDL